MSRISEEDRETQAFALGCEYANKTPLATIANEPTSELLYQACPWYLQDWFDVFKYGAHSVWRAKGELK